MKIAYLMSRFPHLPETFILREMIALERNGWEVALYPLILQSQSVIHAEAESWIPRANAIPLFSSDVLMTGGRAFVKQPLKLRRLWLQVVRENIPSPGFLVRALMLFPKAVYMARRMQAESISHIHAHYATHPALVAWLIHNLTGISYSVTVHAHDIFVQTVMLSTKLKQAAFVVAISEYNRDYLASVIGSWVSEKTHVVHCGIDPENYLPPQNKRTPNGLEIINVGSLQSYKGQKYLIEACRRLREQGVPLRCRIVGGGELHRPLERLIDKYQLQDVVELPGSKTQGEVRQLLTTANCYVQPSVVTATGKMEGIPVALMEAMAAGLPVVATDISGIPELVRPNETGYLVPPADPEALASVLQNVYYHYEKATSLAQAGRQTVFEEFDLNKNVSQLLGLFERYACL